MKKSTIDLTIFTSTLLVYLIPFIAWASLIKWDVGNITLLKLFPLFGLWAFAQMWLHYAVGAIKRRHPNSYDYKSWYKKTSNVVLALILLHPSILLFETLKIGLTPLDYVPSDQLIFLLIAYLAFGSFIAYELAERLTSSKFWQKHFELIKKLNLVAMVLIFIHSMQLGTTLNNTWLNFFWIAMLMVFIGLLVDSKTFKKPKNLTKV